MHVPGPGLDLERNHRSFGLEGRCSAACVHVSSAQKLYPDVSRPRGCAGRCLESGDCQRRNFTFPEGNLMAMTIRSDFFELPQP